MTPLVTQKLWCLCGAHLHCQDAPSLARRTVEWWTGGHVGLGHGLCRPSEAKAAKKARIAATAPVDARPREEPVVT